MTNLIYILWNKSHTYYLHVIKLVMEVTYSCVMIFVFLIFFFFLCVFRKSTFLCFPWKFLKSTFCEIKVTHIIYMLLNWSWKLHIAVWWYLFFWFFFFLMCFPEIDISLFSGKFLKSTFCEIKVTHIIPHVIKLVMEVTYSCVMIFVFLIFFFSYVFSGNRHFSVFRKIPEIYILWNKSHTYYLHVVKLVMEVTYSCVMIFVFLIFFFSYVFSGNRHFSVFRKIPEIYILWNKSHTYYSHVIELVIKVTNCCVMIHFFLIFCFFLCVLKNRHFPVFGKIPERKNSWNLHFVK